MRPLAGVTVERLAAALPFTAHDFIPGLSAAGDRAQEAGRLLRPLAAEHDLRGVVEGGATRAGVFAELLPWDSDCFGALTARLDRVVALEGPPLVDARPAVEALVALARARGVRYLFAHVDARDVALLRAVGEGGFACLEQRVIYHRDLVGYAWPERYPARDAGAADVASLAETSRAMVNRFDRFHADPALDPARVDRLMELWVENSIGKGFADVTLCPDVPAPRAFICGRYHRERWGAWGKRVAQVTLSAVDPSMKGWHRRLMSELSYRFRDEGAEHVFLATQASNPKVFHVWETLGYRLGRGESVFRVLP